MATNRVYDLKRFVLPVVVTHPAAPNSGDPVRVGTLTGVALTDEAEGQYGATITPVDFGPAVYDLSVKGIDDAGNSAVAYMDRLYYVDADTPVLSKKSSGTFFGYALEAVDSAATATINVLVAPAPGDTEGYESVATDMLADEAVTGAKLATGVVKVTLLAGATAGDHALAAITAADEINSVIHNTAGALADLTSEFTAAAAKITNAAGTDTSGDQLLVVWTDHTP